MNIRYPNGLEEEIFVEIPKLLYNISEPNSFNLSTKKNYLIRAKKSQYLSDSKVDFFDEILMHLLKISMPKRISID